MATVAGQHERGPRNDEAEGRDDDPARTAAGILIINTCARRVDGKSEKNHRDKSMGGPYHSGQTAPRDKGHDEHLLLPSTPTQGGRCMRTLPSERRRGAKETGDIGQVEHADHAVLIHLEPVGGNVQLHGIIASPENRQAGHVERSHDKK